jgi:hypothetical protein
MGDMIRVAAPARKQSEAECIKRMTDLMSEERLPLPDPESLASMAGAWRVVRCPTCSKVICKAKPGSTVQVLCNRCKTESVTAVAA